MFEIWFISLIKNKDTYFNEIIGGPYETVDEVNVVWNTIINPNVSLGEYRSKYALFYVKHVVRDHLNNGIFEEKIAGPFQNFNEAIEIYNKLRGGQINLKKVL